MLEGMAEQPGPLPLETFLHTFTLVPRVAVCLQVRGPQGGVLLTQRGPDMALPGLWHYPGAFIYRGETIQACAERVARKELGAEVVGTVRPFGFFENLDADPRGHVIDLVVEVDLDSDPKPTAETENLAFFDHVPADMPFHHDRILRAAGLKEG